MKIEDVEKEVGIPIKEIKKKLEQAGFKKRIGGIITEEEYRYLKGLKGGRTNNGEDQFLTETKYTKDDFIFETISVKDENLWNEELFFKPTAEIKKNLTGPRSPAAPWPEPKILITSSITPTRAPPKKPTSGNQVWPRSKLKIQVTAVTDITPTRPAMVGKTRLNL